MRGRRKLCKRGQGTFLRFILREAGRVYGVVYMRRREWGKGQEKKMQAKAGGDVTHNNTLLGVNENKY